MELADWDRRAGFVNFLRKIENAMARLKRLVEEMVSPPQNALDSARRYDQS